MCAWLTFSFHLTFTFFDSSIDDIFLCFMFRSFFKYLKQQGHYILCSWCSCLSCKFQLTKPSFSWFIDQCYFYSFPCIRLRIWTSCCFQVFKWPWWLCPYLHVWSSQWSVSILYVVLSSAKTIGPLYLVHGVHVLKTCLTKMHCKLIQFLKYHMFCSISWAQHS